MAEVMAQQGAALTAPSSRHDVVSELLDDYTYEDSYDTGDVSPKSALAPASKELPPPPSQTEPIRDPKAEAIQRMNAKFQLREEDESSVSSHGSRNGSLDKSPRTRITSRSLSRSGTPQSLKLYVSNGATAHIPATPMIYAPVNPIPSSVIPDNKDLPPPPPERSIKRKEVQAATMNHQPSKSGLGRNDSFHSQSEDKFSEQDPYETAGVAPPVKRKAVPGAGVKKFVSLLELNNGPRGGKLAPTPTSAPRKLSSNQETGIIHSSNAAPSKIPAGNEIALSNQLPPTPPDEKTIPLPPGKALVGVGLPLNTRTKQPMSPLHTRGKSSTGFNILKAQRPAPPIPTMKKDVVTPEMTPSPTLKPEVQIDHDISPMKPLPSPTEQYRPFSYEASGEQQVKPEQRKVLQQEIEQKEKGDKSEQLATPPADPSAPALAETSFSPRTTSLDPPEPSPHLRPSTAPAPKSTFSTTHPSLSTHTLPSGLDQEVRAELSEPPFIPLTKQSIPLRINLIPRITATQLSCYTQHRTSVWSNNVFQPMGCMVCYSNEKDRKFSCTWCQLRVCRDCSDELLMIPGRNLGKLLEARKMRSEHSTQAENTPSVLVEDVDYRAEKEMIEDGNPYASEGSKEMNT